jgi:hypothetical protein
LEIWKSGNLEIWKPELGISESDRAGLCATCEHVRVIESDRGTRFYMCERSKTDDRFPRYPRLPVVSCIGYDEKTCTPSSPRG